METLLTSAKTVVVIGCSSKPYRTSYHIAEYLMSSGFTILPVNPNEEEVFGIRSYPSIFDIPKGAKVDIFNIFRNKRYSLQQMKEIIEWSELTGQNPAIWTQLDVSTPEAKQLAEESGLVYVENRCIMVEHNRMN
ncbi:MAG: CoA-binding protein [Balneolaceae bacterium]|nr:MAG: CoA-binding protein [Balneolaceae bacterium]